MMSTGVQPNGFWKALAIPTATLVLLALAACGGGGGGGGTNPNNVTITGVVDDGSSNSPIADASCRYIDSAGGTQDTDLCGSDGSFQLSIPPDTQGYIYCGPRSMPDLNLTTFSSTVGTTAGETITNEHVTPTTTVVADIIRSKNPSDPESLKADLLAKAFYDPNLMIVTEIAGRLYRAMLAQNVNARFGDDRSSGGGGGGGGGGGSDSSGGVSGAAGDGADFSPLSEAPCTFMIGDDFQNAEQIYPAALADYLGDGELDRPDLAALSATVSQGLTNSAEEIQQAFSAWFPDGLGEKLATTTDEKGYYFLPVPANLPGFVRCTPKDRENLVLGTYVPGRPADTDLAGQDVTPGTTIFSVLVASQLTSGLADLKDNYLNDIDGLEVGLSGPNLPDGPLDDVRLNAIPHNSEVGLVAFSATALFNIYYKNGLNIDYPALIAAIADHLTADLTIDPVYLEGLGLSPDQADTVSRAIEAAGVQLDTDLQKGLSTARLIVTVRDADGPLAGAVVSIDEETSGVSCDEGCGQQTDASGQLTLTLSGVPTDTATPIPVSVASVDGYDEVTVTTEVVGFSTVDLDIILGVTNSLTIEGSGDGSGTVTSSPAGIQCDINNTSGSADCQHEYPSNTQVTLTASPETGSSFGGWSGACSGTDPCTLTMDQAHTVTATFDILTSAQTLTVNKTGDGGGTITSDPPGINCGSGCSGASFDYEAGTQVRLTASPADDSTFDGWSGGCSGASTSCTVTMDQDRTVTAAFGEGDTPESQFGFSCRMPEMCENFYFDGSGCGDTNAIYSENKCPADGAFGVCTVPSTVEGYFEWVPYVSRDDAFAWETVCNMAGGTWSDTYTGD